jgi:hypothetical protein
MYIQIKRVRNAEKLDEYIPRVFILLVEVHGNCLDLEEEHMSGLDLEEASENCNYLVKGGAY